MDRYVLKLEILTDAFKKSINEVKGIVHNFTSDIKKESKIELAEGLSAGHLIAEVSKAEEKIKQFNAEIAKRKQMGLDTSVAEGNVQRLNDFVNVANQRLNELGAKKIDLTGLDSGKKKVKDVGYEAEDTKQKMSGISLSANMTNNTIVNGFRNAWKSIKRFAFSLLSLRCIYGLVRKASSAYMAQDKGLADQMQRTWASVGAMMAPIIETIVKWIRIGAAYLNYFVKALTGKDLIGKAVKKINKYNKSLGGTAKAAKSVNKELTTLDEVTNLSFDDADTTGIEDAAQAFDDFGDIKLDKKVTDMLDTIAKKVKEVGNFLKPVIDWAVEHPGAVLTILGGTALLTTLGKLVGSGGLLGMGTGLLGTLTALAGLGIIAVTIAVNTIWNEQKGFHKDVQNAANSVSSLTKSVMNADNEIIKYASDSNTTSKDLEKYNNVLLNGNDSLQRYINSTRKEYTWLSKLDGSYIEINRQIEAKVNEEKMNTLVLYKSWKQGKLTLVQNEKFKDQLKNNIKFYSDLASKTREGTVENKIYKERVAELTETLKQVDGKKYNPKIDINTKEGKKQVEDLRNYLIQTGKIKSTAKIDVDNSKAMSKAKETATELKKADKKYTPSFDLKVGTKDAKNKVSNFAKKTNKALVLGGIMNKISQAIFESALAAIPAYDVGTNYVPNDQLAMVHKGEAIVPKKFNNQQFFNQGNEETNALLVEVNQNLIELRNRPNVLEVNGKELAQATYNDYQNEGNRLNQSMTIKRSG